ncbi:hypothetical protein BH09VER1_BH09VER1_44330 [soil metagenome]
MQDAADAFDLFERGEGAIWNGYARFPDLESQFGPSGFAGLKFRFGVGF